jgi:hypothetical protein
MAKLDQSLTDLSKFTPEDLEQTRHTFLIRLRNLHEELTELYDGETFVRLPDKELDCKYDAWKKLQKILTETFTEEWLDRYPKPHPHPEWPEWMTKAMAALVDTSYDRTCREVLIRTIAQLTL